MSKAASLPIKGNVIINLEALTFICERVQGEDVSGPVLWANDVVTQPPDVFLLGGCRKKDCVFLYTTGQGGLQIIPVIEAYETITKEHQEEEGGINGEQ